MKNLKPKALEVFAHDLYATEATGVTIEEAGELYAKCQVALGPQHRNAKGAIMGGVMFTLADLAFAVSANWECLDQNRDLEWVSQQSSISYLAQPKGNCLVAESHCVKQGRRSCLYTLTVTDELGTLVAHVETLGAKIG